MKKPLGKRKIEHFRVKCYHAASLKIDVGRDCISSFNKLAGCNPALHLLEHNSKTLYVVRNHWIEAIHDIGGVSSLFIQRRDSSDPAGSITAT